MCDAARAGTEIARRKTKPTGSPLGQQQPAAILDRGLRRLGKALQQPGQGYFQPDMIVGYVDMARCRLSKGTDSEDHAAILPPLLLDRQHRNARGRPRQPVLEATHSLFAAKTMRDRNDEGRSHA